MTNLLLDTHAMLWFFWDDPQLSGLAKALIEDADNRKLVSIGSCWESSTWANRAARFCRAK